MDDAKKKAEWAEMERLLADRKATSPGAALIEACKDRMEMIVHLKQSKLSWKEITDIFAKATKVKGIKQYHLTQAWKEVYPPSPEEVERQKQKAAERMRKKAEKEASGVPAGVATVKSASYDDKASYLNSFWSELTGAPLPKSELPKVVKAFDFAVETQGMLQNALVSEDVSTFAKSFLQNWNG